MSSLECRIGAGSILRKSIVCLVLMTVNILLSYFYAPAAATLFLTAVMWYGWMLTHDHVPIGAHGRLILREELRLKRIEPPAGVPGWVARFASEEDNLLLGLSALGALLGSIVFGIASFFASGPHSARAPVDLGVWQLCFVPHLVWFVTLGLRQVRNGVLSEIEGLFRVQAAA